jgi:hypothetical protein
LKDTTVASPKAAAGFRATGDWTVDGRVAGGSAADDSAAGGGATDDSAAGG